MAVPVVEDTFVASDDNENTTLAVTLSGVQAGDLLIAICTDSTYSTSANYITFTAGWTKYDEYATSLVPYTAIFWKEAAGGETSATMTTSTGNEKGIYCLRISGADTESPFDALVTNITSSASSSISVSGVTAGVDDALAIAAVCGDAQASFSSASTLITGSPPWLLDGDNNAAGALDDVRISLATLSGGVDTYYFDASDAGATDPDAVWTNDANAFDGSTATNANSATQGSTAGEYLMGGGTNAPITGANIGQVRARMYGASVVQINATIYTSGKSQLLASVAKGGSAGWGNYVTLNTPTGGWTWQKVNDLEAYIYNQIAISGDAARVEIEVTSALLDGGSTGGLTFSMGAAFKARELTFTIKPAAAATRRVFTS